MNSELMAMFGIIASIGLLTMVISSATPTMTALANGDKCISKKSTFTSLTCLVKNDPALTGEAKKECRESGAKCSSSQTGFGEYENFKN